jgi:hypothetical protein
MLPRLDAFLAGIKLFARRRHPKVAAFDEQALADAVAHAAILTAGREERDEPAALFFACALRSRAFGAASHDLLPLIARNQARGLGLRLDIEDVVLAILHARILLGAIPFEEVRTRFRAAFQPTGLEPARPPPRRPG